MLVVKRVEGRAEAQIDQEREQGAERRDRERALALAARLHREQPLHQVVVGAEGRHRADEAVEHGHPHDVGIGEDATPEVRGARRGTPVDDVQPARLACERHDRADAAVHAPDHEQDRHGAGHEEHERLKHVRPDDRLDATRRDVSNGDDGEDRDRQRQ